MSDPVNHLQRYLNGVADQIKIASGTLDGTHNGDLGDNRESICENWLKKHIPHALTVHRGGQIFDVNGKKSKQIDIVVTHNQCVMFSEQSKQQFMVEGVAAAMTVKTTLKTADLKDSLDNLVSIPQLDPEVAQFPFSDVQSDLLPMFANLQSRYFSVFPNLFVYAYDGIELSTCVSSLWDYIQEFDPPNNRLPKMIVVHGKYAILLETWVPQGQLRIEPVVLSEAQRGYPILWIAGGIGQSIAGWRT